MKTNEAHLTQSELMRRFKYNPETGLLYRIPGAVKNAKSGIAGCTHALTGYVGVKIDGSMFQVHRLAWLYVYGCWPSNQIDHINGERADNRIANLRDVTNAVNRQNIKLAAVTNKVGLLGVTAYKGRFRSFIVAGGELHRLGVFESAEEAHEAHLTAKRRLHIGCTI